MNIEEIDAAITVVNDRAADYILEEEMVRILGAEWVENNPSFRGVYSLDKTTNILLESRLELMEGDENGSIQEELDSLTGSDISVG